MFKYNKRPGPGRPPAYGEKPLIKLSISIPEEMHEEVNQIAEKSDRSMSYMFVLAMRDFLKGGEKKWYG